MNASSGGGGGGGRGGGRFEWVEVVERRGGCRLL